MLAYHTSHKQLLTSFNLCCGIYPPSNYYGSVSQLQHGHPGQFHTQFTYPSMFTSSQRPFATSSIAPFPQHISSPLSNSDLTPPPAQTDVETAETSETASKGQRQWTKEETLLALKHITIVKPSFDTGVNRILSWPRKFELIHTSIMKENPSFRYIHIGALT